MHDLGNVNSWLQLTGAALVIALGAAVALVRPRTRRNLIFAGFMVAFGSIFMTANIAVLFVDAPNPVELPRGFAVARLAFATAATVLLAAMASTFPTALRSRPAGVVGPPLVVALAVAAAFGFLFLATFGSLPGVDRMAALSVVGIGIVIGGLHGYQLLLALRYAGSEAPDVGTRRQFALISSAVVLYTGFVATAGTGGDRSTSLFSELPGLAALSAIMTASHVILAATWLWAGGRSRDPRPARNVALVTLGVPLVGLVYAAVDREVGGIGIARTLAVLVLTYAIMRHQLLGLDVKVRWTVKQSTVAAIFVAVFFAVSEGAQSLFSSSSNSTAIGIAAAGALVFAIHPLQRVAERVAVAAVPVAPPAGAPPAAPNLAAYRTAVELALSDGKLTRDEERSLAKLQVQLGVDAVAALAVREEIEESMRRPATMSSRRRTRRTRSP